jgi:hypothetical protein
MKTLFRHGNIFIIFFLAPLAIHAQTIRTERIAWNFFQNEELVGLFHYNEFRQITQIEIQLRKGFHPAKHLNQLYPVYSGDTYEFYTFIGDVENFAINNKPRTSAFIQGHKVSFETFNQKLIFISENKDGYTQYFRFYQLKQYKKKYIQWMDEHGLPYKKAEVIKLSETE